MNIISFIKGLFARDKLYLVQFCVFNDHNYCAQLEFQTFAKNKDEAKNNIIKMTNKQRIYGGLVPMDALIAFGRIEEVK